MQTNDEITITKGIGGYSIVNKIVGGDSHTVDHTTHICLNLNQVVKVLESFTGEKIIRSINLGEPL